MSPQIEEMYSIPESFLEIEVRNPQTHGPFCRHFINEKPFLLAPRFRSQDVYGLWDCLQGPFGARPHLFFTSHSPICRPISPLLNFATPLSDEDTPTLRRSVIPSNVNHHASIFLLYQAKSLPTGSLTRSSRVGEKVWSAFWALLLVIRFFRSVHLLFAFFQV